MNRKVVIAVSSGLILLVAVLAFFVLQKKFGFREMAIFPTETYEVYAVNDSIAGGYSTSEIHVANDGSVLANVNIRSGKAYSYAGVGVNLLSVNHRPAAEFFDFDRFDSIEVDVRTGRMQTVEVRILNNDPVYSRAGELLSYRPKTKIVPANMQTKIALADFKTPEWWLAEQGLDKDDYLSYFDRGVILAVVNGEKVMRGIPDEIELKSIRLWRGNKPEEGK
ncbi:MULTISPECIES: CIA30 family protein [unclassified Fibrobacter]|uniref:CIA30 family protein n=1 Tax=unclassified Fibrobacter TaxID=2634177 RepID=UPI000D6D716A|nr:MULTISPECIES: CIA30 family protein [unclassified Fibrobacter]PWJ69114.1 complex I intermediate-associated protein 30 (CIA30) [Fibrobacter sp. UWR4]PZW72945.1 complex I intermediate-associated protein 30 (CIA30) [Fibrobacter sp. UWR1]